MSNQQVPLRWQTRLGTEPVQIISLLFSIRATSQSQEERFHAMVNCKLIGVRDPKASGGFW